MTARGKGIAVLAVQMALVLSIAAKYAWERHTCPRVWTRTAQYDPERPMRGRYLALELTANACGLGQGEANNDYGFDANRQWTSFPSRRWNARLIARDGKLTAVPAEARTPDTTTLLLREGAPCDRATITTGTEFFISEHAKTPFPLASGHELWAEVTVPPSGPPRPIQLAVSDGREFHVLNLK